MTELDRVQLIFAPGTLPGFARIFSEGVTVFVQTGCSLKSFLHEQLGLAPDYVAHRIQTIFCDGNVVDDLEKTLVADGSVVALSAAMPGLAGATLRRDGFYAAMRNAITHQPQSNRACALEGTVTVKLFNLLIPEIGPLLLQRGIGLNADGWRNLLADYAPSLKKGCRQVVLNDRQVTLESLTLPTPRLDRILLKITEMDG